MDYGCTKQILQGREKEVVKKQIIAWSPPAFYYLKLNIYGSWKEQNDAGGGGVFIGVSGN